MTVFNLPDLGEGLPDAEIVKWLVAEGQNITLGDPMVEMSTAKAVVEVPAPFSGEVVRLHGGEGDIIETGAPLITVLTEGESREEAGAGANGASAAFADSVKVADEANGKSAPRPEEGGDEGAEGNEGVEVFHLPDLGEGLPDAEIVKWLVAEGATVAIGDPMVEMSTAKAVVEVPAPFAGQVTALYGGEGDVIETGAPLIAIRTGRKGAAKAPPPPEKVEVEKVSEDAGTVVGQITVGKTVTTDVALAADGVRASPAVRAAAKKLGVDLRGLSGSGADGAVTMKDVRAAAEKPAPAAPASGPSTDVKAGPAARQLAAELGIDLAAVSPSGPKGAVTKRDVTAAARDLIVSGARPTVAAPAPQAAVRSGDASLAAGKDVKAAPRVRAYARDKGVDLHRVRASGATGNITIDDINAALKADFQAAGPAPAPAMLEPYARPPLAYEVSGEPEKLIGPRRVMAQMMARANAEICHTPIFDEADISAWLPGNDVTVRVMRAVVAAAMVEPAINAWYDHGDGKNPEKTIHRHVSLGVAVDSPRGLFVPVVRNIDSLGPAEMRAVLDAHRKAIADGSISPKDMSGATITLSNYGMMAGRFAAPIISAPEVAIVGIGGLFDKLVMTAKGIENHRFVPVSLTFDHRACTGGEAARFLRGILDDLMLPN